MNYPSLIDGQTNEQTGAMVLLLRACWLGAGCNGVGMSASVLLCSTTVQLDRMLRCGRKCGGGGDQTGVSGHLGRAAGGQRVAGSSGG